MTYIYPNNISAIFLFAVYVKNIIFLLLIKYNIFVNYSYLSQKKSQKNNNCIVRPVWASYKNIFLSQGKYVGVITFTNAACDEIKHRTNEDPIFHIATIHGFCWSVIQGFNNDIREFLNHFLKILEYHCYTRI